MSMRRVKATLVIGLVLLLLTSAGLGYVGSRQLKRRAEANQRVSNSHACMLEVTRAHANEADLQTAARSYFVTKEKSYLELFESAREGIAGNLKNLRELTAQDQNQQKRIEALVILVEERIQNAQQLVRLHPSNNRRAAASLIEDGSRISNELRAVLAEIESAEQQALQRQQRRVQRASEIGLRLFLFLFFVIALSVVILAVFAAVTLTLRREMATKEQEAEMLRASQEYFENIVNTVREPLLVLDRELRIVSANRSFYASFQCSQKEAKGRRIYELGNAQWDTPTLRKLLEDIGSQHSSFEDLEVEGDVPVIGKRTMLLSARSLSIDNRAEHILLSIVDITERKIAEQDRDRFFTVSLELMCIAGFDGYFKRLNPAWETALGFTREELMAAPFIEFVHPEDRDRTLAEAAALSHGQASRSFENRYRCRDGSYRWFLWTAASYGQQQLTYATARDITDRKANESTLVQAKDQAESANRFKDQFLSNMSHELRTPLNAILGFAQILLDPRHGSFTESQRGFIQHIRDAGKHLLGLINDILDLSKIESGRLDLMLENLSASLICSEVADVLRPLAQRKSQTISVEVDGDCLVHADARRMKQVLMNLAGNAVKFTPDGGRITLRATSSDGMVRCEIQDSGPGIRPEDQAAIFEAFQRLPQTAQVEGTGLGLAIARKLVELHSGMIGLESEPGKGTCFYFCLPAAVSSGPGITPRPSLASVSSSATVLVVEDDECSAKLIEAFLDREGYKTVLCLNPESAVEMARKTRPDAITLDLVMRPVNGWQILSVLKQDERTREIPIVIVTIVDQREMGLALGAEEYLVKPVESHLLREAIARCLGKASDGPILVVEDDASLREALVESLAMEGYKTLTAADGHEAQAKVAKQLPALVILDLGLPGLSGLELLTEWRGNSATSTLPVLVLTGKDLSPQEEEQVSKCSQALLRKQESWRNRLLKEIGRFARPPVVRSV